MKISMEESKYLFKILWSKTYIGIAIDEIYQKNCLIPLTVFYFWPQKDGWKLLEAELDSKPWMVDKAKQEILNGYTLIIKYWLENVNENINLQNISIGGINFEILAINSINSTNLEKV